MMRSYLKYRPAWAQLLIFFLLAFGFFMMAGMIGTVIVARVNSISMTTLQQILEGKLLTHPAARNVLAGSQVVQFLSVFIIPSMLFAWMADPRPLRFAGLTRPWSNRYYSITIGLVLASVFMVGFLTIINKQIELPQSLVELEKRQNAAVGILALATNPQQLVVSILIIGVLAAIGEELFFRGMLQRILIQLFGNPWVGIVVTAIFFSAIHMQFSGFLPRMVLGIALGALYWYSGSIWPGILFHFIYNSLGVLMAYNRPEKIQQDVPVDTAMPVIYTLGIMSIAFTVYLVTRMIKNSQTEYAQVYPAHEPTPFDNKVS